jgi:hypothetical protein
VSESPQCPPCILSSKDHHTQKATPSPGESGRVIIGRIQTWKQQPQGGEVGPRIGSSILGKEQDLG